MNAATGKKRRAKRLSNPEPDTLVYGIGNTGLSIARYLSRRGIEAIYVDSRGQPPGLDDLASIVPDADVVLGETPGGLLDGVSRIIVSPGVSDSDALLAEARNASIDVISDIELFTRDVAADFVAISGSNGKSTVTTLLSLMCEASGKRTLAGANLGRPALDLLAEETPDLYLLELSSFQLQRTRHLPATVAVLLNISPDHLDWHADEQEYREAKLRIFDQALSAVVNRDFPEMLRRLPAELPFSSFALDAPAPDQYGVLTDSGVEFLARGSTPLIACSDIAMVGRHNCANALAALAAGELLGLEMAAMLQVLNEFPGLPHRMQFVCRRDGVDYINDSKATNVDAAIASVRSVAGPVVLIAGGQGKGGDFHRFASSIGTELKALLAFGEDAGPIADAFKGITPLHLVRDLTEALGKARELAVAGDTVLLAPACASFDQFDNYMRRGDAFSAAARSAP